MQLRDYQTKLLSDIRAAWAAGQHNVCAVLPTGGGKTVCFATILREHNGEAVAIAHRGELVSQMSLTLAKLGVYHRIIAPKTKIRQIVTMHAEEYGRTYYDPQSRIAVGGVDTLVRRDMGAWAQQVTLWVVDEGHHLLAANKWGKACGLFPNARGLGVTATPMRADGRGLGRHNDGLFDALVCGPSQRVLIDQEHLTEYRIFAPKSDVDLSDVPMSDATGDFSPTPLRRAVARSHITGDVVQSYLRIAPGKLGVTFCVSVQQANETAAQFRDAGVPAECVSADTPDHVRAETLRRFAARKILQLVNVDLFGEGFDLPAIEVVSMARPTASFGLYAQQFGRALRTMDGKQHALIIDHVGNVLRHGLPDAPRVWTLDRREKRSKVAEGEIKIRVCSACAGVYERVHKECPYCGNVPEPASRAAPSYVDGDLLELDPAVLARLRGDAAAINGEPKIPYGATPEVRGAIIKRHRERQAAQRDLRHLIALYGGWNKLLGRDDSEGYRRFFAEFDIDVATAQTLGTRDAAALRDRIASVLTDEGIKP
jgi:superfamily II DNA or RNA helicase